MKAILIALAFLCFTSSSFTQTKTFKLGFTGAYPSYFGSNTYGMNWSWYSEFKMNTWCGWWMSDTAVFVLNKLDSNNLDGYFQPDTLRWAGYGRVQINNAAATTGRFIYSSHRCGAPQTDNSQFGNGQTVMFYNKNSNCNEEEGPQGLVLWNVKENWFQSYAAIPYDPKYQVPMPSNSFAMVPNNYYIKPKIRIDSVDAHGTSQNVVRIIIKAYNGSVLDSVTIKTDFFLDNFGNYNGKYLEDFDLPQLIANAVDLNVGRTTRYPTYGSDPCQVDYQIYWYGAVSFWIDYVKVIDEAAQTLYGNRLQDVSIRTALKRKVERLNAFENTYGERMKGFYMEEVDYSNIACLKLLNDSLPVWSGNTNYKMVGLVNSYSYRAPLKKGYATDYADYLDAVEPPVMMFVAYPFEGPAAASLENSPPRNDGNYF